MSKRLQIILDDSEYREVQKLARSRHLSIAEWVRQTLALAGRQEQLGDIGKKLEVIRAATRHEFPTAEIDAMLTDIESGNIG
jgi:hypothetical protein